MKLFISPISASEWKINVADFKVQLEKYVLGSRVWEVNDLNRKYILEWELFISNVLKLEGRLSRDLISIVIECRDAAFAFDFIKWYASWLPAQEEICIYDESFEFNCALNELSKDLLISLMGS